MLVALGLVLVGFGFKISAVPFHFWTPDVYEGAPTPITSLLSTASKAASFGLLLRFLLAVFPPPDLLGAVRMRSRITARSGSKWSRCWRSSRWSLGNLLALVQGNIKRLLAYSTIAHAGYILMGVAAISTDKSGDGAAAVAFYLFIYVLTNTLAFAVVILFTNATGSEADQRPRRTQPPQSLVGAGDDAGAAVAGRAFPRRRVSSASSCCSARRWMPGWSGWRWSAS